MTRPAGSLTKRIPARTKTVNFLWIKREFLPMCQDYRDARKRMRTKKDSCFWCCHKFEDGEMMALAAISGKLNQLLCGTCVGAALQLQEQRDEPTYL